MKDDFEQMDEDAGVVTAMLMPDSAPGAMVKGGIAEYRNELVRKYHDGATSLVARLRREGKDDGQSLLVALLDEVIKETDNLLGNQLIATENGELRDASVISFKRAEVLEKAVKAVQARQQFEKESGVDLDSPSMLVVIRYFMSKSKEVFGKMDMPPEQSDIFFRMLGEVMENWKKELREELEAMRGR